MSIFFWGVLLGVSLSAVPPKMVGISTVSADGSFRPAVFGPWRAWSHGRYNPVYTGCCCIPAASVVSSRRLPLVCRASVISSRRLPFFSQAPLVPSRRLPFVPPVSVVFVGFLGTVFSKVAGAPTESARKMSVVSSFRWGGGGVAHPECPGRRLPDPGGRSGYYPGCLHLEGIFWAYLSLLALQVQLSSYVSLPYPVGECTGRFFTN
jgi:hypothetical protein